MSEASLEQPGDLDLGSELDAIEDEGVSELDGPEQADGPETYDLNSPFSSYYQPHSGVRTTDPAPEWRSGGGGAPAPKRPARGGTGGGSGGGGVHVSLFGGVRLALFSGNTGVKQAPRTTQVGVLGAKPLPSGRPSAAGRRRPRAK